MPLSTAAHNTVDWRSEYPFSSHYFTVEQGLKLHYLDEGEGVPVLMLHGNPTWSFFFRRLIPPFTQLGRRVIAPDHIGCGLSDKPRDYPYQLLNHIDNLEHLLDYLQIDECDLIVHDWGGAIGCGWAVRHPSRVRKLAVLNSAAFLSPRCPWRIRLCRAPVFGPLAVRGCNGFARAALRMAVANPANLTDTARQGYLAPYDNWNNRIATLRFVQDIPLKKSHPTWSTLKSIEEGLPELRFKPMIICWGMRDFCFSPPFLERWKHFFPDAEIHRLHEVGHYVLEDSPRQTLSLLSQFLVPEENE